MDKINKRNVLVINLAAAFIWMSMYSYVPTLPGYAMSLGATATMVGIIGGAYGVLQILLRIPLGIIEDKTGKDKLLLIFGFVMLTVAALVFIVAKSPEALVLARGVAGAAAAWWVIICSSYAKYNSEDRQVKAQGILSASANGGKVIACLFGGIAAQSFGLAAPFYVALIAAVVGLICMFAFKTPPTLLKKEPPSAKTMLSLLKNRNLIVFSVIAILSQLICFAIPSYFASVAATALGASSADLGWLVMVYFAVTAASSLLVGTRLYKKVGGIKMLIVSFISGAVSCIPFFYTQGLGIIYVMQALSGVCYGISISALQGFIIRCVNPSLRSTATGIFQSLFAIGIFLGPVIVGGLLDHVSFDAAYWSICVISLVAAVLCAVLIPKEYDKMR